LIFQNKRKIINDPVFGFITIPNELIFDIIEHPYFQRLRRIKQLGLSYLVYPGALHTRFNHSIGTIHLMKQAVDSLRIKGHDISDDEENAVVMAILLHDIGHCPYSHTLENFFIKDMTHEDLTNIFIDKLNVHYNGALTLAGDIYKNVYNKKFLHKLVSGQLDLDRLDYLKRDSFYTGVAEGAINCDRIIKMLDVVDDNIVVEAKGIYSIENFIVARRLMYWQVYLHKTVLSAENMLINILKRAKYLAKNNFNLFATPALKLFLVNDITKSDFINNDKLIDNFALLDDYDIYTSIKVWCNSTDKVLSILSRNLVNRKLFRTEIRDFVFDSEYISNIKKKVKQEYKINDFDADFFVFTDEVKNSAYNPKTDKINILYKTGEVVDVSEASDQLNVSVLSKTVRKYFLCYPKLIAQ